MNEHYEALRRPPKDALRTIEFGPLKGKSDINPQWKYEAMTEEFGLCGIGWKFEIADKETVPVTQTGEVMIFVVVNLYVKDGESWSSPIPGCGGDFLIKKDKNGIHGNDEGLKMAITDALGNAAKMIGVAADVYRGKFDTKFNRNEENASQSSFNGQDNPAKGNYTKAEPEKASGVPKRSTEQKTVNAGGGNTRTKLNIHLMQEAGKRGAQRNLLEFAAKYGVKQFDDITRLSDNDFTKLYTDFMTWLNPA